MRGVLKHYKRYTALLAALEELSTRGPMSTLVDILAQLRAVGFHDPLTEAELRDSLDQLAKWRFVEPFRDYAALVRGYQGLTARQEAWALTRKGRGIVAAVRSAVVDAGAGASVAQPPARQCGTHNPRHATAPWARRWPANG